MIRDWITTFFAWPNGSIWSNILAWVICGALAIGWARRKLLAHHRLLIRHHDEQMAKLNAIHATVLSKGD